MKIKKLSEDSGVAMTTLYYWKAKIAPVKHLKALKEQGFDVSYFADRAIEKYLPFTTNYVKKIEE